MTIRSGLGRRDFLRVSALAAGAAAGCASPAAGPGAPSAAATTPPASPSAPPASPRTSAGAVRTGARTGPARADWAALGEGLDGRLIRPGEASYDEARRLYNPSYDGVRPGGVAYCENPGDVAECLAFARRTGAPLTSRSGGHGYAGWSTGTGLVVDVSPMSDVRATPGRAVVGAGAQLVDVYDRLAARGVSIPAGSCPTVGIAGLTLGGGLGVVARRYGLTCDVLESVRVVTADGRLLTCDARHHADLYWASRGGGGGNFGVAVSFTFRTHRTQDVTVFSLGWPWSRAPRALDAWQRWAPRAPDALWSNLHLGHDPVPDLRIGGLYLGSRAACERELEPLLAAVGSAPSVRSVTAMGYADAMMTMAGCASRTVSQCHRPGDLPGRTRDGRFPRDAFVAASHLAYRPLTASGVKALVEQAGRPGRHSILLDALGGAVARVRPDATAFPHRQALFSAQYYAHRAGAASWLRGAHAAMEAHFGAHAYVNYIDPTLRGWRQAYYGPNAARLSKVKAAYDPDRLFDFPQAV
ncbi:FAD-binding oxidoreductase [Sphaerisporangium sp. TRM90804]|uniref:FAD-binding oxidoreductase n=1 Tax=Sphaerisporangium sp. TRM90804 TaxID=3031113 RepID=UPI00244CF04E|nr:FAD-binding oxidoreductase [Sphaerisporangium sp. TRM90804]MDH2427880.1 FAD-binding oxidoreductase [Sphaerisporangium sp. TRM90804]